jgi:hypothetical protein
MDKKKDRTLNRENAESRGCVHSLAVFIKNSPGSNPATIPALQGLKRHRNAKVEEVTKIQKTKGCESETLCSSSRSESSTKGSRILFQMQIFKDEFEQKKCQL